MSEKIVTTINQRQYIEWDSPADCLLFWAWLSSFEQFQALHQQVTGEAATTGKYDLLRSSDNGKRFKEIVWRATMKSRNYPGAVPVAIAMRNQLKQVKA